MRNTKLLNRNSAFFNQVCTTIISCGEVTSGLPLCQGSWASLVQLTVGSTTACWCVAGDSLCFGNPKLKLPTWVNEREIEEEMLLLNASRYLKSNRMDCPWMCFSFFLAIHGVLHDKCRSATWSLGAQLQCCAVRIIAIILRGLFQT